MTPTKEEIDKLKYGVEILQLQINLAEEEKINAIPIASIIIARDGLLKWIQILENENVEMVSPYKPS